MEVSHELLTLPLCVLLASNSHDNNATYHKMQPTPGDCILCVLCSSQSLM